jgi:hypothetical protein
VVRKSIVFLATLVLSPSVLVLLVPQLNIVGPTLLVAGFGSLILFFLAFSFRRSKAGPFAQWIQPGSNLSFAEQESLLLRVSACLGLGGALAVGVLLLTA